MALILDKINVMMETMTMMMDAMQIALKKMKENALILIFKISAI